MGSPTPRGPPTSHHNDACDVAFDRSENLGTPDQCVFGAQSPCPFVPLPTLRLPPRGDRRTARGETWFGSSFVSGNLHPLPSASSPGAPDPRMRANARGSYLGCLTTNRCCCLPYPLRRLCHARPALCPVRALASRIPLGFRPFPPSAPPGPRSLCSPPSAVLCPDPIASTRSSAIRNLSSLPRPRYDGRGGLKPSQVPCMDVRACLGS